MCQACSWLIFNVRQMKPWKFYAAAVLLALCSLFAFVMHGLGEAIQLLVPSLFLGEALAKISISERERILGAEFSLPAALACIFALFSLLAFLAGRARRDQIRDSRP